MDSSIVKKMGVLPSLVVSLFLLTATVDTTKAHASTVNYQSPNGVQLAWWGGGYYHGGYGGYRRGYIGPAYYNYGYRPYYRNSCQKSCWRNRWGNLRCATRCY
jgi:hypothetical protein